MNDDLIKETIWTEDEFKSTSEQERFLRTIREQIIPYEMENRVKAAGGKASKYYVYGRPKTGGKVISKDKEGINIVSDRALLGVFDSEEEARAFQSAINNKIKEYNKEK